MLPGRDDSVFMPSLQSHQLTRDSLETTCDSAPAHDWVVLVLLHSRLGELPLNDVGGRKERIIGRSTRRWFGPAASQDGARRSEVRHKGPKNLISVQIACARDVTLYPSKSASLHLYFERNSLKHTDTPARTRHGITTHEDTHAQCLPCALSASRGLARD